MPSLVPESDLPRGLSGKFVPDSDLPFAPSAVFSNEPPPDTGFTGALKSSYERMKGEGALLAGKVGLMSLPEAEQYKKEQDVKAEKAFKPTDKGWTEAPVTKFKELVGGSLPYMVAPLAGAGAAIALAPEAAVAAPV